MSYFDVKFTFAMCCELPVFQILCQEEYEVERGDISSVLSLGLLEFIFYFSSVKKLCSFSPLVLTGRAMAQLCRPASPSLQIVYSF